MQRQHTKFYYGYRGWLIDADENGWWAERSCQVLEADSEAAIWQKVRDDNAARGLGFLNTQRI